eukprot:gene28308-15541_t
MSCDAGAAWATNKREPRRAPGRKSARAPGGDAGSTPHQTPS